MFIEAHWKVLKRTHLYKFNKARLDLLTFVIIDRHCRSLLYKLNRDVIMRSETTRREKNFCVSWNECVRRSEEDMNEYYISIDNWICGCPAFSRSRMLICKHLVHAPSIGRIAPRSRFVLRKSWAPYIDMVIEVKSHIVKIIFCIFNVVFFI